MKKLLILVLSLVCMQTAYADNTAKLRMKISGAVAGDNRYFLCVGSVGCVSIKAGNAGQTFPMTPGQVEYIYTTNLANLRLYTQALPASCKVDVNENQTVTVTGRLTTGPNQQVYISNLNCKVA